MQRRVVGVDAHVAVAEVAAVDGERALADAEAHVDEHLVAGEVLRELDEVGLLGRSG